jgi:hypothetical protein
VFAMPSDGATIFGDLIGKTAQLTDLNNLGNFAAFNAPLTVGIFTFTTDDGLIRYANFGVGNSLALGDNTDLGFINIAIAPGANVTKFGFYVGLNGEAQVNRETVSFFDINNVLLGTIGVSRDGGLEFVGWENPNGIGGALITDTLINSTVVTVDNLLAETPIPPTALLFGSGLGLLASFGWWRKRKSA